MRIGNSSHLAPAARKRPRDSDLVVSGKKKSPGRWNGRGGDVAPGRPGHPIRSGTQPRTAWGHCPMSFPGQWCRRANPFCGGGFAATADVVGSFTSVVRATGVSATAAKSVNNDVVVSSVVRRIVCIKKVLKVGWITEITSARI